MTIAEILLWLFVINLGIAFGAGLYEQSIIRFTRLDSHVRVNGDAQYRPDAGRRFWAYVTTVPLTLAYAGKSCHRLASAKSETSVVARRSGRPRS